MKTEVKNFTEGPITGPLVKFMLPILLALILQALYGAVDLLVVGRFARSADISAVATGSQLMTTVTNTMATFSTGVTILLGHQIGQGRSREGGRTIGASILLFFVIGLVVTAVLVIFAGNFAGLLKAPREAYTRTVSYIRICGAGSLVIIFYNMIGAVFRGIGDSNTPLVTVAIATVVNIFGDLFNVAVLGMGAAGAALATVAAQAVSVFASIRFIRKRQLPFEFRREMIRADRPITRQVAKFGFPIALQDFLVGVSFLVINAIVNGLGLVPSAGVGVAEKVCAFIMLVPSAFSQSLAAFVAQNYGAGKFRRAFRTLYIAFGLSLCAGFAMFWLAFFHGTLLTGIFTKETQVIEAGADYLKSYAIDCILTAFLFCFIGFFNGLGMTSFVMVQGLVGAFCVRIPVSYFMSRQVPVSLFHIGLATPCSSLVQILLCLIFMIYAKKKMFWKTDEKGHPG
ncbi:MAG: MATE family efflux transporter [Bilifractor sp.]|jgi:putative MATE family efflux protein